jgi:long-chain acyl-CoA synthetase
MIDWWGPVLQEYYCGTEGQATTVSSEEWLRYPGTVGRPYPGVDIRIVDDGGNELPVGQPGNIHIRHAQGWTFEYLGDAQATFASRTAAYFTLGDVGYCNEEGYLFICDRRVDSINVGGEKVFSIEVEHALMQHPAVADCAVLGFKDGLFGETVWAFVQPGAGFEPGLELRASILEFISGRLATWKLPRHIEFRSELPRGPNGKIYKKQLRETLPSVPTDGGS